MRMNGDEANRLLIVEGAEPLAHFGRRKAEAAGAQNLDRDEIAVAGGAFVAGTDT